MTTSLQSQSELAKAFERTPPFILYILVLLAAYVAGQLGQISIVWMLFFDDANRASLSDWLRAGWMLPILLTYYSFLGFVCARVVAVGGRILVRKLAA